MIYFYILYGYIICGYILIILGGLADYEEYQYKMFRLTTVVAAAMNFIYIFLWDSSTYWVMGFWTGINLVFLGLSVIYYNSMLVDLVDNHWLVRRILKYKISDEHIEKFKETLEDDISGTGYAFGYFSSLIVLLISTGILFGTSETTYQQIDDVGYTGTNKYSELNMKPVTSIYMRFNDDMLFGFACVYENGINTDVNASNFDSIYTPNNGNYIEKLKMYYNETDNSVNGFIFTTTNGVDSVLFGSNNGNFREIKPDNEDFILGGYNSYTSANGMITGFDILYVNEKTGNFGSLLGYRLVIFIVGLWWSLFQIYSLINIKKRKKIKIPNNSSVWTVSLKDTYETLKQAKKYSHLFKFLIAWFFYSDGVNTLFTAGIHII